MSLLDVIYGVMSPTTIPHSKLKTEIAKRKMLCTFIVLTLRCHSITANSVSILHWKHLHIATERCRDFRNIAVILRKTAMETQLLLLLDSEGEGIFFTGNQRKIKNLSGRELQRMCVTPFSGNAKITNKMSLKWCEKMSLSSSRQPAACSTTLT